MGSRNWFSVLCSGQRPCVDEWVGGSLLIFLMCINTIYFKSLFKHLYIKNTPKWHLLFGIEKALRAFWNPFSDSNTCTTTQPYKNNNYHNSMRDMYRCTVTSPRLKALAPQWQQECSPHSASYTCRTRSFLTMWLYQEKLMVLVTVYNDDSEKTLVTAYNNDSKTLVTAYNDDSEKTVVTVYNDDSEKTLVTVYNYDWERPSYRLLQGPKVFSGQFKLWEKTPGPTDVSTMSTRLKTSSPPPTLCNPDIMQSWPIQQHYQLPSQWNTPHSPSSTDPSRTSSNRTLTNESTDIEWIDFISVCHTSKYLAEYLSCASAAVAMDPVPQLWGRVYKAPQSRSADLGSGLSVHVIFYLKGKTDPKSALLLGIRVPEG